MLRKGQHRKDEDEQTYKVGPGPKQLKNVNALVPQVIHNITIRYAEQH